MATDCVVDGDYLGAYSRFFAEFVARVNPNDQLPVKVSAYDVDESELVGEVISVTLQYLNKTYCPPSLQSYIVHLVIEAIKSTCKKQPEICGLRPQEKTYAPLKLMQAVTNEVNEICRRYLDNSRLALLPPPSSTPQVTVGATRNARRKMEDRHMILHDLHTIFNIQDDTMVNYYAVFDGHGGQDAAAYCATHLHQYLVESVYYPTDPESALRDAFLTTDAQFIAKSSTQKLNGGTTAVCALLLNKKLYIAWVGDSMASLVTGGNVKQLVNPHRPTREDESERIRNMGGVVVHCMGVLRVNGFLSISRAIGDVSYKPYVSGEPEVRCVSLDGTEDFLIIACDGLWDYVDQRTAALRVYRQVLQNPHDLKHVHQALLQSAKRAGSLDNITVIVVFLTPPVEIASRHSLLKHQPPNGLLLNNMDPNNPVSSNSGQFDVNAAFIKQQQQMLEADLQHADFDFNRVCGMARNGKHQDGDGNDDDDDYADLGPETDVDAEDATDINRSLESLITSSSSREFAPDKSPMETEVDNEGNNKEKEEDLLNRDNANICPVDSVINDVSDNRVILSDKDVLCDERPRGNNDDDNDDNEARVESTTGTHTLVDDDKSPPSPRDAKTLQHALISEAENVAESEDSEDEWNYYRIDPNKVSVTAATGESGEGVEEQNIQNLESGSRGDSEIQSSKVEADIKCEGSEEKITPKSISNTNYSEDSESEEDYAHLGNEDMAFQLNPDAAEFVPLSPPLISKLQDYAISGSPLKQTPMDDIYIPTQIEFEQEIGLRPKEIDEDFSSDEQHAACESNLPDMNMSEISSTKAEVGDESMARIVSTTTQWQMDNSSQWSATTHNNAESDSEEYEIVNMDNAMTISFTPGDFEVAFEKGVDLNAVHDLNDSSDDAEHINTPPRSPGGLCVNESVRADTPLDDKAPIDLLCVSSTPHPADSQSTRTATSECDEGKVLSVFEADGLAPLPYDPSQIKIPSSVNNLIDKSQCISIESKFTNSDKFKSASSAEEDISKEVSKTNENPIDNQQPIDLSKENYNETFELLSTELESVKLTDKVDKIQNEGEQTSLCEKDDKTQSKPLAETMKVKLIECVPSEIAEMMNEEQLTTEKLNKKDITDNSKTKSNEASSENVPGPVRSDTKMEHLELSDKEIEYQRAEQRRLLAQPNIDTDIEFCMECSDEFKPSNWTDFYKTGKSMLLEDDEPYQCNKSYMFATGHQESSKTPEKDNKNDKNDDDAKPASTDPSDLEKDFTTVEKLMQPEGQTHEQNAELPCTLSSSNAQTEQKLIEIETASANVDEIPQKQIASEDISTNKQEEIKPYLDFCEETTKTLPDDTMTMKTVTEITSTSSSKAVSTTAAQVTTISSPVQSDLAKEFVAAHPKQLVDEKPEAQPNINTETGLCLEHFENQSLLSSNWADFYKIESKSMLLEPDDIPNDCNKLYSMGNDLERQESSKTSKKDDKNDKNDKDDKSDGDAKPDSTDPSDLKKDSTEKPMQPESQAHEQNVQLPSTLSSAQTEQELIEIEAASANIDEISEKQIASEDISTKEETKPQETAKALPDLTKMIDFSTYTNAATVAAAATTATVSTTKAKATTTATKRSTKTTTTTKTATKITPASPSKAVSTTTARVTATSPPVQPALAKKSVAARPKQLVDGSTKAAAISSVGSKITGTKTTTSSKNVTTASKTSISPRVSTTKSRTSTASTASSKSSTLSAEKKSATNIGETKPVGKVAATAAKPTSTKTTTTKITPIKSMPSTTTTTSNVTLKPRSTSAGTTVKTSATMSKQSATVSSSRPKTAPPTSSSVNKLRENSTKTTTAKSPLIDKQSKESANKEISRSSATGTLSSSKTGSRPSAPLVTTTAAKRLSVGKSPGKSPGSTISPIKKSALTPKAASRTASSSPGTKSTPLNESQKVLQNGISEKRMDVTRVAVITATNDKPEDDVPRKDTSPVNVPTDNQLIITD